MFGLLPAATATTAVGDMGAPSGPASGNSATSHDCTATINRSTPRIDPSIGAAAILIVGITISPTIVATPAGYDRSPSNDRSATIGGTASNGCTASDCGTAASCATPVRAAAAALAADQQNLGFILSVTSRSNFEGIFWKDRNRRAHCRQDKQSDARKTRKGQPEPDIAECHVVLLSWL